MRIERPPTSVVGGMFAEAGHGWAKGMEIAESLRGMESMGLLTYGVLLVPLLVGPTVGGFCAGAFTTMSDEEVARRIACLERAFAAAPPCLGLDLAFPAVVARVRPALQLVAAGAPADAVLHLRISDLGLVGPCGVAPEVVVFVELTTTWKSGSTVHHAKFHYRSSPEPLTVWTADPARIGVELARARTCLGECVADELLLVEVCQR